MMWLLSRAEKHTAQRTDFPSLLVNEAMGVVELAPRSGTELDSALEIPASLPIAGKPAPAVHAAQEHRS